MKLTPIEKRSGLTREEFESEYLEPLKPVVLTDMSKDWAATKKWTYEFFREKYGDIEVPLYNNDYNKPGKGYMSKAKSMSFGEYLDILEQGPTELRMFLFNLFKYAPELVEDYKIPEITDGFLDEYPFMFFGGEGSHVNLHYDIDRSHVFLTQFQTRKRLLLFHPDQSKKLYQLPFTVASAADLSNPDYEKFPALKEVEGFETVITHGETVFIPSCYWHYIEYTDSGFSMALRSNDSLSNRMMGAFNIARHFLVDKGMNYLMGDKWKSIKHDIARRRARA